MSVNVSKLLLKRCSAVLLCIASASSMAQTAPAAPDWVLAMQPGTWAQVGSNSIRDVDPQEDPAANPNYPNSAPWRGNTGLAAVMNAWNGGALASRYGAKGSLIVHGGGHQDYYGNEIYAFDFGSRTWSRVTNPYKGPFNFSSGYSTGTFPDGSPVVPHTYDQVEYHPPSNSFLRLRSERDNVGGNNVGIAHMFSFDEKRWTRSPTNTSNSYASGGWSAYDNKRDVFWAEAGGGSGVFAKFDPKVSNSDGTRGAWTNYGLKVGGMDAQGAYSPAQDIVVVVDFRSSDGVHGIDVADPSSGAVKLREGGTAPAKDAASGWEWSDIRKAFLYWRRGDDVYELKASGSDWRAATWTWSNITSGANSAVPAANTSQYGLGDYSRFRVMRYSNAEIAAVVTRIDGPVYVFKIPGSQDLIVPNPPTEVRAD